MYDHEADAYVSEIFDVFISRFSNVNSVYYDDDEIRIEISNELREIVKEIHQEGRYDDK